MYHAAIRGWRWILRLFKDISKFREFLNKDVLVKNARSLVKVTVKPRLDF